MTPIHDTIDEGVSKIRISGRIVAGILMHHEMYYRFIREHLFYIDYNTPNFGGIILYNGINVYRTWDIPIDEIKVF